jgi:hypothetical protein
VVLHELDPINVQLVVHTKDMGIKYVWIGLGYDYYDLIFPNYEDMLLKQTREYYRNYKASLSDSRGTAIKKSLRKLIYKTVSKEEAIKNIGYFSPVLEIEYQLVKNSLNYSEEFPKYISWNYANNMSLADRTDTPIIDRSLKNVLLGNSATFTNNHIDIINLIAEKNYNIKKILCPLNYGLPNYGDYIENLGDSHFGKQFYPIRKFMPFEKYIELIESAAVVIMNHKRQQAAGNVLPMLIKGASVFLREESPLYQYHKELGIILFSTQELERNPELIERRLSDHEVHQNREIIKMQRGTVSAHKKTENLIRTVMT